MLQSCAGSELYDTEDWLVFASAGEGASRGMATDKRFGRLSLDPTVAIALCTKGDSRSVVEISGNGSRKVSRCITKHIVLLHNTIRLSCATVTWLLFSSPGPESLIPCDFCP